MRTAAPMQWQRLRFILGVAQMTGAAIALGLLLTNGLTRVSVYAAVLTTLLTAIGLLLREHFADR